MLGLLRLEKSKWLIYEGELGGSFMYIFKLASTDMYSSTTCDMVSHPKRSGPKIKEKKWRWWLAVSHLNI
jgi:hypothetical protein